MNDHASFAWTSRVAAARTCDAEGAGPRHPCLQDQMSNPAKLFLHSTAPTQSSTSPRFAPVRAFAMWMGLSTFLQESDLGGPLTTTVEARELLTGEESIAP